MKGVREGRRGEASREWVLCELEGGEGRTGKEGRRVRSRRDCLALVGFILDSCDE